jgi:predicted aldo/keto reductase-like oxidoreductase
MKEFKPLNEEEYKAIEKVRFILASQNAIPCTKCRYCVDGCPQSIQIPDIFELLNNRLIYNDFETKTKYDELTNNTGKASSCVECGQCESNCPQGIKIIETLKKCVNTFEK